MQPEESNLLQGKYKLGKLLGKGSLGSVFEVERIEDHMMFALKRCYASSFDDHAVVQACREATTLKLLMNSQRDGIEASLPCIVQIEDFWVDELEYDADENIAGVYVNVIMELVKGYSLAGYIDKMTNPRIKRRSTGGFSKVRPGENLSDDDEEVIEMKAETTYNWVSQVTLALHYIHHLGIVHRDVKPENILISNDLKSAKLADFSISKVLSSTQTHLTTSGGTINYCAPELLRNQSYDTSCDMWSLGCVVYELLTFQKLFKVANVSKILSLVSKNDIPSIPDDSDSGLSMICHRLLNVDPLKRPSAKSLCNHPRIRPFVIQQLMQLNPDNFRDAVIKSLGIDFSPKLNVPPPIYAWNGRESSLVLLEEPDKSSSAYIEDQYDDEIECEVVPLLQGLWEVEDEVPRVTVLFLGRTAEFSDKRSSLIISRAHWAATPLILQWALGRDYILMKSKSSFITPQRLIFAKLAHKIEGGKEEANTELRLTRPDLNPSNFSTSATEDDM